MSESLKDKIKNTLTQDHDLREDVEAVIKELSHIYYKFGENPEGQKAFREAGQWMCSHISEGKWATVQKRFYRKERQ